MSQPSSVTPPPPPLVADRLADFSDRLSPMLVKELRQGLRARTFVTVFLGLQILLGLVLLSAAGASTPQNAGRVITSVIFLFFSLATLIVQPLRGIGVLHNEIKANTMEMLVLTRLDAWRIVLGKWIALVSQSALLLAAIVPYLILRYWFGDMNLLGELLLLLLVFIASALCTAITVGISPVPSILVRGLLPLGGAVLLTIFIFAVTFDNELKDLIEACALQTRGSRWGVFSFLLASLYLIWTFLGIGAAMIAPAAENHATPRRLVTLGALVLAGVLFSIFDVREYVVVMTAAVIAIPSVVVALSEPFALLPPVARPFVRLGNFGRFGGRILYPGWPSGVFFALLVSLIGLALLLFGAELIDHHDSAIGSICSASTLLLPAVVVGLLGDRLRNRFVGYLLVFIGGMLATFLFALLSDSMGRGNQDFLWLFVWIPQVNMMMAEMYHGGKSFPDEVLLVCAALFAILYALILCLMAVRHFGRIREVELTAANEDHATHGTTDET